MDKSKRIPSRRNTRSTKNHTPTVLKIRIPLRPILLRRRKPEPEQGSDSQPKDLPSPDGTEQEEAVASFWLTGQDIGSGWKYLDWFGNYLIHDSSSPWVYHSELGWIYLTEMNLGSTLVLFGEDRLDLTLSEVSRGYSFKHGSLIFVQKGRYFDYVRGSWVRP